jgi:autotransporter adhesin
VLYDDGGHAVLTLDGADGTRIGNVANGVDADDAVNLGQMEAADGATLASAKEHADAGDAATLASASDHADAGDAETLRSANAYTDTRVAEVAGFDPRALEGRMDGLDRRMDEFDHRIGVHDRRINIVGALSSAMSMIAPDARVRGANQFSMGVGHFRDRQAIAVGYSRTISSRASVRIGAAFADSESTAGVGFNVGW